MIERMDLTAHNTVAQLVSFYSAELGKAHAENEAHRKMHVQMNEQVHAAKRFEMLASHAVSLARLAEKLTHDKRISADLREHALGVLARAALIPGLLTEEEARLRGRGEE